MENAVSELGSLIAMGVVESSDTREGSVCCGVAVFTCKIQGRYSQIEWQLRDLILRELWALLIELSIPTGEADGQSTTILLNLYN